MKINYYQLMGIPKDASFKEIKSAYHRLANEFHPDKHSDHPELEPCFKKLAEAYRTLKDLESRKKYDQEFEPVNSLRDLFHREAGYRVMESLLPQMLRTPRRGNDILAVVKVEKIIINQGGKLTLPDYKLTVEIPPPAYKMPWCRIPNRGKIGKNGAPNGDLLILIIAE